MNPPKNLWLNHSVFVFVFVFVCVGVCICVFVIIIMPYFVHRAYIHIATSLRYIHLYWWSFIHKCATLLLTIIYKFDMPFVCLLRVCVCVCVSAWYHTSAPNVANSMPCMLFTHIDFENTFTVYFCGIGFCAYKWIYIHGACVLVCVFAWNTIQNFVHSLASKNTHTKRSERSMHDF